MTQRGIVIGDGGFGVQKRLITSLSAVFLVLVGIESAWAHRPYFTQVERVVLPNGQPGELRLLHGDGIFGPDPIRVLVLDADSRLIARSYESTFFHLVCGPTPECKIFDFHNDTIMELDPQTFRVGGIVQSVGDPERERLWQFIIGNDVWGFRSRPASVLEQMEGNWALLVKHWGIFAFTTMLGALAGFACFAGPRRAVSRGIPSAILWTFLRILFCGVCAVLSLVLASLALTTELWLSALASGVALTAVLVYAIGGARRPVEAA